MANPNPAPIAPLAPVVGYALRCVRDMARVPPADGGGAATVLQLREYVKANARLAAEGAEHVAAHDTWSVALAERGHVASIKVIGLPDDAEFTAMLGAEVLGTSHMHMLRIVPAPARCIGGAGVGVGGGAGGAAVAGGGADDNNCVRTHFAAHVDWLAQHYRALRGAAGGAGGAGITLAVVHAGRPAEAYVFREPRYLSVHLGKAGVFRGPSTTQWVNVDGSE